MIANNLTTENQVPNFLDYIYKDALNPAKRYEYHPVARTVVEEFNDE